MPNMPEYSKSRFSTQISIYFEFYKPPHHPSALKMSKIMQNTQGNQISFSRQKFEFDFFTPKFGGLDNNIGLFTLSPMFQMPK